VTWPGGIASVLGLTAALLILIDQHKQRSTTHTQNTRRTEHDGHDPTDTHRKGHQPGTRHTGQEDRG
jgi:hypothetical protein